MNARSSFASRNRSLGAKLLEVVELVGRRLVVVGDAHPERDLRGPVIASDGIHEIAVTDDSTRCVSRDGHLTWRLRLSLRFESPDHR